jgi:peroxiredoxin
MKNYCAFALAFCLALALCINSGGCAAKPTPVPAPTTMPPNTPIPPNTTIPPSNPNIRLKLGDKAPEFSLQDINGGTVVLSHQLAAGKVVINMWWLRCHGCTDEMPYLQEFYENWYEHGLTLLAINVYDTVEMIRDFVMRKGLTFTFLLDAQKKLNAAYTNAGVPTTFFLDGSGTVRAIKDGAFESTVAVENIYQSY